MNIYIIIGIIIALIYYTLIVSNMVFHFFDHWVFCFDDIDDELVILIGLFASIVVGILWPIALFTAFVLLLSYIIKNQIKKGN